METKGFSQFLSRPRIWYIMCYVLKCWQNVQIEFLGTHTATKLSQTVEELHDMKGLLLNLIQFRKAISDVIQILL